MSVVLVETGVGNTASVLFALERLGARARLSSDAAEIAEAERVILPGVSAAAWAMRRLDELGLRQVLTDFPRPLIGVCLGHQLLFESSAEGEVDCLGLLPGRVDAIAPAPDRPVPHMGWNRLRIVRDDPLLEGVEDGAHAYFVHAFAAPETADALAVTDYGAPLSAVVRRGNVMGCQFHPERSGAVGARVLANFLSLPC